MEQRKTERDESAMQQAQQINTAPNMLLLSNMPNQMPNQVVVFAPSYKNS